MSEAEPTLKCVVAWSESRNLCSIVEDALGAKMGADDIRKLGDDSFAIYVSTTCDEIRDWVAAVLTAGESVLVFEFEKWSGRGPAIDSEWLMRRGH